MTMVRVARMPQTIDYEGKKYGPSEGPLDVPLELAVVLGLQRVGGEVAESASDGQELAAAQSLASQYQRNLELLLDQIQPHVKADIGETPDQTLERLIRERESIRGYFTQVSKERDDLMVALDNLKQENQNNVCSMNAVGQQATDLQAKLDVVTKECDDARRAFADAKLLPDDALARLESVQGISKALAQKGLDALLASAEGGNK